jgi:hypothetical protein
MSIRTKLSILAATVGAMVVSVLSSPLAQATTGMTHN